MSDYVRCTHLLFRRINNILQNIFDTPPIERLQSLPSIRIEMPVLQTGTNISSGVVDERIAPTVLSIGEISKEKTS